MQIERFAPGFRDCILARHKSNAVDLEKSNPNLACGDINGAPPIFGNCLHVRFSVPRLIELRFREFICARRQRRPAVASTACGYHAARAALRERF